MGAMKLLADENMPGLAVDALRGRGHDVEWVRLLAPGIPDPEVIARAVGTQRLLVTFDKDFGELVFRRRMPVGGVILLRFRLSSPVAAAHRVVAVLESRDDWMGSFSVVEEDRVRMTPLPGTD